jgi:glycerol kinase
MQFQADVLGIPVERPDMVETTALGAAALAGVALGVWRHSSDVLAGRRFTRFEPQLDDTGRITLLDAWSRGVSAALAWAQSGRKQQDPGVARVLEGREWPVT